MPLIRNVSGEARDVPALGRLVGDGEVLAVPSGDVYAYTVQAGTWEPADDQAQGEHDRDAHVEAVVTEVLDPSTPAAHPAGNDTRDVWAAFAIAKGASEADVHDLTRDQLRETYGTES